MRDSKLQKKVLTVSRDKMMSEAQSHQVILKELFVIHCRRGTTFRNWNSSFRGIANEPYKRRKSNARRRIIVVLNERRNASAPLNIFISPSHLP
jgi:hypothetical protein